MSRLRLAVALALVCVAVRPATADVFMSPEEFDLDGDDLASASGDLLSGSDVVSDGTLSARPTVSLATAVTLSIYPQERTVAHTYTDVAPYHVFRSWSVASATDPFPSTLAMSTRYFEGEFNGPETGLKLFKYDLAQATWMGLSTTVDVVNHVVSASIGGPGLYAIGSPGSDVPILGAPGVAALVALLALSAVCLLRRRAPWLVAGVLLMATGSTVTVRALPEVTNPGGRPIMHVDRARDDVEPCTDPDRRAPTECKQIYGEVWEPREDTPEGRDYTQSPNWKKGFQWRAMNWNFQDKKTGKVTVPPDATWDDSYLSYDSAVYAFRGPATWFLCVVSRDAKTILDNEYNDIGAADGNGYQQGDIVSYVTGSLSHLAKVNSVDAQGKIVDLVSKWGHGYIYKHAPADVPGRFGKPSRVYRHK
jgi:hypothetical protein